MFIVCRRINVIEVGMFEVFIVSGNVLTAGVFIYSDSKDGQADTYIERYFEIHTDRHIDMYTYLERFKDRH